MLDNENNITGTTFEPDRPISDPSRDQYDRAPFAASIARAIRGLPPGECFVIGLHGAWGDGKSTVLEITAKYLKDVPAISFKLFNPWRFTSEDRMIGAFFQTIAAALGIDLNTKVEKAAGAISAYLQYFSIANEKAAKASDLLERHSTTSLEDLRERVRRDLRKCTQRVVIFVDDIDRLHAAEAAVFFRALKACADLPNLVYVLAFDRDVVAASLNAALGGMVDAGQRYLEKIIQIPLAMPPASLGDLQRVCKRGVQQILLENGIVLGHEQIVRWHFAFERSMTRQLKTPRNVIQYLNAVRFAMAAISRATEPVDVLLVEALRIFFPQAYAIVRERPRAFAGVSTTKLDDANVRGQDNADPLACGVNGIDPRHTPGLDFLLGELFPQYHLSLSKMDLGPAQCASLRAEMRVASPGFTNRYFTYVVGSTNVSEDAIRGIVQAAHGDNGMLVQSLIDLQLSNARQSSLVESLLTQLDVLETRAVGTIAVAFSQLADRFEEPFSLEESSSLGLRVARAMAARLNCLESHQDRAFWTSAIVEASTDTWFAAALCEDVVGSFAPGSTEAIKVANAFGEHFAGFVATGVDLLDSDRRWKFEAMCLADRISKVHVVRDRFISAMETDGGLVVRLLRCYALPTAFDHPNISDPQLGPEAARAFVAAVGDQAVRNIIMPRWIRPEHQVLPEEWCHLNIDNRLMAQLHYWYANPNATA